jgi:hypothetical protein
MATGLLDIMKRASIDAEENAKPADLRVGTVTSTSPLAVQITNQFVLPDSMLIVPESLTDHEVEVTVDWSTESAEGHKHSVTGKKTMIIHGALKTGDKVALLRKRGGQSYLILDRV